MTHTFFLRLLNSFFLSTLHSSTMYRWFNELLQKENVSFTTYDEYRELIKDETAQVSESFVAMLLSQAELLFIENGMLMYQSFNEYLTEMFTLQSPYLRMIDEIGKSQSSEGELRSRLFHKIHQLPALSFCDSTCAIVGERQDAETQCLVVECTQRQSVEGMILDSDVLFARMAVKMPMMYSMSQFSGYDILFQQQEIKHRIAPVTFFEYLDDQLLIGGEMYGVRMGFNEYCARNLSGCRYSGTYDPKVTIVNKTYVCPIRKRSLLEKGVVYGAPFTLIAFYDIKPDGLRCGESGIIPYDKVWFPVSADLQESGFRESDERCVYFDSERQLLFINDQPIVNGKQARLLDIILRRFYNRSRRIFEWRELAEYDELICDQYSTGLSTRLNRLIETLDRKRCGCRIEKIARGKYVVKITGALRILEKV